MAKLVIKWHETRGKEVIEIFEMLGTKNCDLNGCGYNLVYYIRTDGYIGTSYTDLSKDYKVFTLEEFLEKYPYKVGDKVIHNDCEAVVTSMAWNGDEVSYVVLNKGIKWQTTVSYLQPYKEETPDTALAPDLKLKGEDYSDRRFCYKIPNGYEFDCVKNNEIILKHKQPGYPKTYEECCKILNIPVNGDIVYAGNWVYGGEYLDKHLDKLRNFQKLLICRAAYWKIAGEQIGLDKPWEPDCSDDCIKYVITVAENKIYTDVSYIFNYILIFPTEEMRNGFCENFKELIEECKEFL